MYTLQKYNKLHLARALLARRFVTHCQTLKFEGRGQRRYEGGGEGGTGCEAGAMDRGEGGWLWRGPHSGCSMSRLQITWQWVDSGRVTVTAHALKCKLPEGYDQQTNPSKREKKKKQEENDRQTLPEAC